MLDRLLNVLLRPYSLALVLALGLATPQLAFAQDDPEDEDEDEPEDDDDDDDDGAGDEVDIDRDTSARARRARETQQRKRKRPVREVVKGAYAKINLGPLIWLPPISGFTSSTGTQMDFSFGYDVLDQLNFTLTVEASFFQIITNGDGVSIDLPFASPIQGDFRVFGGIVAVRAGPNLGGKRVKRLSIQVHAGGGVGYSPLLVDAQSQNVVARIAAGYGYIMQGRPLGIVQAGVGVEYFTRLSHFSLGLDLDFDVLLGGPVTGMGLGIDAFVKYTF